MADIGYFLGQGWRNIWKQKSILFFAAITSLLELIGLVPTQRATQVLSVLAVLIELGILCFLVFFLAAGGSQ